jgi:hypothetical protein
MKFFKVPTRVVVERERNFSESLGAWYWSELLSPSGLRVLPHKPIFFQKTPENLEYAPTLQAILICV